MGVTGLEEYYHVAIEQELQEKLRTVIDRFGGLVSNNVRIRGMLQYNQNACTALLSLLRSIIWQNSFKHGP